MVEPTTLTACGKTWRVHPAAAAFPLIEGDAFAGLVEDIRKQGLIEAISVDDDELLDGRNRLRACDLAGVKPHFTQWRQDRGSKTDWIVSLNLRRRHLDQSQRAMLANTLLPIVEAEAKERQRTAGIETQQRRKAEPQTQLVVNLPQAELAPKSRDIVAAMVGVSPRYVQDAKKVAIASPTLAAKVQAGVLPLYKAKAQIVRAAKETELEAVETKEAKAIAGVFDVIVIDPPWPMQKIERELFPNQTAALDYPVMSLEEIAALKLPMADACHVWLWTTHRFLPDAFDLLETWGLHYVCCFVWHKPGGFQPVNLPQFNCEFALYARRGGAAFLDTKALPTCFEAKRGRHSEKPAAFYDTIQRVTGGRRLDMFARIAHEGFDVWGKEAPHE